MLSKGTTILAFAILMGSLGAAVSCSKSNFSGSNTSPKKVATDKDGKNKDGSTGNGTGDAGTPDSGAGDSDAGDGAGSLNADGTSSVTLPVGSSKSLPGSGGDKAGGSSCTTVNTDIASVDTQAKDTCKIVGNKIGETDLKVKNADGTTTTVHVIVTPVGGADSGGTGDSGIDSGADSGVNQASDNGAVDGGKLGSEDGGTDAAGTTPPGDATVSDDSVVKTISGRVCLGGPNCRISYVTHSEAEATQCMHHANARDCANDPGCGGFKLQVCDCSCSSPNAINFDSPDSCRRFNPERTGAHFQPICK